MKTRLTIATVVFLFSLAAAASTFAGIFSDDISPAEERTQIEDERKDILKKIFEKQPGLEQQIKEAPGYATFSVFNMNLLLVATARGTGIVVDNIKHEEIYMDVLSIGGGIGAGVKDLNMLIIFNEHKTLEQFTNSGWQFEAKADAALKSGEKGAEIGEAVSVAAPTEDSGLNTSMSGGLGAVTGVKPPMEVFVITEAGIAAQATVSGVKFSRDDELNNKE